MQAVRTISRLSFCACSRAAMFEDELPRVRRRVSQAINRRSRSATSPTSPCSRTHFGHTCDDLSSKPLSVPPLLLFGIHTSSFSRREQSMSSALALVLVRLLSTLNGKATTGSIFTLDCSADLLLRVGQCLSATLAGRVKVGDLSHRRSAIASSAAAHDGEVGRSGVVDGTVVPLRQERSRRWRIMVSSAPRWSGENDIR